MVDNLKNVEDYYLLSQFQRFGKEMRELTVQKVKKGINMNDKEYKEWETKIEETEKENNLLLADFEEWLKSKKLKPKTIKNHRANIEFYINGFLLRDEIISAKNGITQIGSFLGDYFIRKASWASEYTLQENIAGFKKFYTFLNEIGKLPDNDFEEMKELIKKEKDYWLEEVESYWDNIDEDW